MQTTFLLPTSSRITILWFSFALLAFSCDPTDREITEQEPLDAVEIQDAEQLADKTRNFGWELFRQTTVGMEEENVLISPLSIQTALTMAVNGAGSETREQMLDVLGCEDCSLNSLNQQMANLRQWMEEESGHPDLQSANGYFFDDNRIQVRDEFKESLTEYYSCGFENLPFHEAATVGKINDWISDHTRGKINKIIDNIQEDNLAFLINALHFKADWSQGFDPAHTYQDMFHTISGAVEVDYVNADRQFMTSKTENFEMLDLPFRDSTYSLSMIQPSHSSGLSPQWISSLQIDDLENLWQGLSYGRAMVRFPKLKLEYRNGMIPFLKELKMILPFSVGQSDFSKMGESLIGPNIYISDVLHEAVLEVDEKGAEGAAVTSITFSTTSIPPTYYFDKPFIIVLRHIPTNTMVFTGLVNDPSF